MRIHVYHESAGDRLADAIRAAAPDREVVVWHDPVTFEASIAEAEVIFCGYPPRASWAGARRLQLIQLMGAGADVLLPAHDLPPDVVVAGLRGEMAAEASEHAVAMLLALARGLPTVFARQREHTWRSFASPRLAGARLCVVGLGAIGSRVARVAAALGMRVEGVSRAGRAVDHVSRVYDARGLHDALANADYVVVTLPLTDATRGLIGADALAALPAGARLVQIGRGGVIDEAALLAALEAGALGGAALDVFDTEPLPSESPLWDAPNLIVTPHVAGLGLRYIERAIEVLLDNVGRLERDEPVRGIVDRAAGY